MKTKDKAKSDNWEYFDDCLVCQAMKVAKEEDRDLSKEELETVYTYYLNQLMLSVASR